MKRYCNIIIGLLFCLLAGQSLAACSPGYDGSNLIAFIREGQLWTIDGNGANAFTVVAQETPVVGYTWSPDHRMLSFRTLEASFAKTNAARQLPVHAVSGLIGDAPSTLNTIGIDGGSPIPIALSSPDVRYSNALWNASSTRLLHRQTSKAALQTPGEAHWWILQNDQPGGIAAKALPTSYSIPSFSYYNNLVAGNSERGLFTSTLGGSDIGYLTLTPLPGHPLPAPLERVLWQPAHEQASLLYALPAAGKRGTVQLVQRTLDGQTKILTTCSCRQFAWSPDGNAIVYSEGATLSILNLRDKTTFTLKGEESSVPYWSPDSRFLLLDGEHTLILVSLAQRQQQLLLSEQQGSEEAATGDAALPSVGALLQPIANSVWAASSRQFLFNAHKRLLWQGSPLPSGPGLYTVRLDEAGRLQGPPAIITKGNISQAGWTYQDPDTTFLY
jgi:hypothetical protein